MTDTKQDARRWNAFVCQDCRAIFRVPSDYAGTGVVCPRCDRMLRMPKSGEEVVPLQDTMNDPVEESAVPVLENQLAPETAEVSAADEKIETDAPIESVAPEVPVIVPAVEKLLPAGEWKKRKHKQHIEEAEDAWQQRPVAADRVPFSKRIPWWMGPVVGALLMALIWALVSSSHKEQPEQVQVENAEKPMPAPEVVVSENPSQGSKAQYLKELKEIESVIESFLSAKQPSEMLPWLRKTPELEKKIATHYQATPWVTWGFSSVDQSTIELNEAHTKYTAIVVTADYDRHLIHLIRDDKEFRVDWESWVGWCEKPFEKILQQLTTSPVEIRARVESESYYNFDFPKEMEKEWESYRLVAIDGSTLLHGYVKRGSDLANQLRLAPDERSRLMVLRIYHSESATELSQVLIESIVETGWVKDLPQE